jgi:hypothetical protein
MTDSRPHSRRAEILTELGADPRVIADRVVELEEQHQALRDLIDGAGVSFEDSRLNYIEIQVDRDAFIALRPDAIPALSLESGEVGVAAPTTSTSAKAEGMGQNPASPEVSSPAKRPK